MTAAGIRETRQHLVEYLAKVERGEEVIITRRNQPIARILPITSFKPGTLTSHRELRASITPGGKSLSQVVIDSREGEPY